MARARTKSHLEAARAKMYRELVFECAERVFGEQGYEESTMQDIAAEAGISLRTLYGAYEGKKEIHEEIHTVRATEFLHSMAAALMGTGTAAEQLSAGVRSYVDFLFEHRAYFALLVREGRAWTLDPQSDADERWRQGLEMFADLVRRGMDEGDFYPGDPSLMAATGMAVMQVQMAGLLRGVEPQDPAAITAQIVRQLRRLLIAPKD